MYTGLFTGCDVVSMTKGKRVHGKHKMYGLYDMFSATDSIDEARLEMFARKQVI
jgi:hypothetical protein